MRPATARSNVIDMASSYRSPDPKKQLSARVKSSIHAKLARVVEIWRERAKAEGEDVDEIDLTFVIEHLLGDKVDEELAQWGGFPVTPESLAAQLKAVREGTLKKLAK